MIIALAGMHTQARKGPNTLIPIYEAKMTRDTRLIVSDSKSLAVILLTLL